MKTGFGECECIEGWVKQLIFEIIEEKRQQTQMLAFEAKMGRGDSPFTVCMRQAASGPAPSAQVQQERFGRAAMQCAGASRNPQDLLPKYEEERKRLDKLTEEFFTLRTCL